MPPFGKSFGKSLGMRAALLSLLIFAAFVTLWQIAAQPVACCARAISAGSADSSSFSRADGSRDSRASYRSVIISPE